MQSVTIDEIMVVSIARLISDGEIVAQGLATPMVAAGYLLARLTHAPNLYFVSAIGQGICREPAPLGLTTVEKLWLDRALINIGFTRAVTDVLPTLRPLEFFRPAQVDPFGNFNNIAFGKDYLGEGRRHPRLRLPGTGGIPDVTTFISKTCLYTPRHSRLIFVPKLDAHSGLGHTAERKAGTGPIYLISDLGQFDFANGRMRLISFHPGISPKRIQSRTGFTLEVSPNLCETPLPTSEEIRLLREEIDPLGIRKLELLSGGKKRELLHQIIKEETQEMRIPA